MNTEVQTFCCIFVREFLSLSLSSEEQHKKLAAGSLPVSSIWQLCIFSGNPMCLPAYSSTVIGDEWILRLQKELQNLFLCFRCRCQCWTGSRSSWSRSGCTASRRSSPTSATGRNAFQTQRCVPISSTTVPITSATGRNAFQVRAHNLRLILKIWFS